VSRDDVEQRGLSRAVGADQPANLARLHLQIDTVENLKSLNRKFAR
jgi:hypothetical protein